MENTAMEQAWLESPVGRLELAADAEGLRRIEFPPYAGRRPGPSTGVGRRAHSSGRAASVAAPGAASRAAAGAASAAPGPDGTAARRILAATRRQLEEYFAGRRTSFDLPLAPQGTSFQLRVWEELRRIPYGQTISYGELARRVGLPRAARAVGAANGANPLPIVVPCHRVIGANGTLTGFGGGIEAKAELLAIESGQRTLRHAG